MNLYIRSQIESEKNCLTLNRSQDGDDASDQDQDEDNGVVIFMFHAIKFSMELNFTRKMYTQIKNTHTHTTAKPALIFNFLYGNHSAITHNVSQCHTHRHIIAI